MKQRMEIINPIFRVTTFSLRLLLLEFIFTKLINEDIICCINLHFHVIKLLLRKVIAVNVIYNLHSLQL